MCRVHHPDTPLRRAALRSHIEAGRSMKDFAFEHGFSSSHCYKMAKAIGYAQMRVTPAERRLILKRRGTA